MKILIEIDVANPRGVPDAELKRRWIERHVSRKIAETVEDSAIGHVTDMTVRDWNTSDIFGSHPNG